MNQPGAPKRNDNARGHGLYSSNPPRRILVPIEPSLAELSEYAMDLAAGALWIAMNADEIAYERILSAKSHQIVVLYAAVSQELNQVAAELAGEVGIKPAPLGQLSDKQYEVLMEKQAKALELILNQCISTFERLKLLEEIPGAPGQLIGPDEVPQPTGLFFDADPNPVLAYLAGHMRSAKRIMREMAANRAWKLHDVDRDDDLSNRIMNQIGGIK